jgi:hypothetical protein
MLIVPPNTGGGGGNCLPSIVVVPLGEPGGGDLAPLLASSAANAARSKLSRPEATKTPSAAPTVSTATIGIRDCRNMVITSKRGEMQIHRQRGVLACYVRASPLKRNPALPVLLHANDDPTVTATFPH